jgi:hypothetical protein
MTKLCGNYTLANATGRAGRRYDMPMVWSIDRLGRNVLHATNAVAEIEAGDVALASIARRRWVVP